MASKAVRIAIDKAQCFGGRWDLEPIPIHLSDMAVVLGGTDKQNQARVVVKLMRDDGEFKCEAEAREILDTDKQGFVVPIIAKSDDPELRDRWKSDVRRLNHGGFDFGLVMAMGQRNLETILRQEGLSLQQTREMLEALVRCLGDVHSHNLVHAVSSGRNAVNVSTTSQ